MNQRGNHNFYNAVEANPIIAAVKNMDDVENCCRIEEIKVVFILFGDICSLEEIINKIKKAGKTAVVHVDLINGLSSKEIAVEYIKKNTAADGIISTKISLIKKGEGGRAVYSASIFPVGFNGGREYQAAAESGTAGLYRSTSRSHAESDREAL